MDYKIIVDTSCDLTQEMERDMKILSVPFKITIDDREFIDDENLNIKEFIGTMISNAEPIKTSCPSPYDYLEKLNLCDEKNIFIITISQKLSGSYNSAIIARKEYLKENPDKNVYVIDSQAASAGQTSILLKLWEIIGKDSSFDEKIEDINEAIKTNQTFFILERLDNLVKNGRIKKTAGIALNMLNIKPIMMGNIGEISLYEMNRGVKKGISKLSKAVGKIVDDANNRILVISHVDALDRAIDFKEKVKELYEFKDIIIVHTKGLASGYADKGGIVIGF